MSDYDDKSLELDHEYDGIKELDHPLPLWWLITFYGGIVFAICYIYYFSFAGGPSLQDEYGKDLKHHKAIYASYLESLSEFDEAKFHSFYDSQEMKDYGKTVFEANCMACHAKRGAGDIGPNLTDNAWLYAEGTPDTIFPFILTGNPEGGMPSWSDKLEPDEIYALLGYIMSLQGQEHEKAKEAEGEEYPLWSKSN